MKQSIINYYVRRQLRLDARQDGGKWGYNKGVANGKRKAGEKKQGGGEQPAVSKVKKIPSLTQSQVAQCEKIGYERLKKFRGARAILEGRDLSSTPAKDIFHTLERCTSKDWLGGNREERAQIVNTKLHDKQQSLMGSLLYNISIVRGEKPLVNSDFGGWRGILKRASYGDIDSDAVEKFDAFIDGHDSGDIDKAAIKKDFREFCKNGMKLSAMVDGQDAARDKVALACKKELGLSGRTMKIFNTVMDYDYSDDSTLPRLKRESDRSLQEAEQQLTKVRQRIRDEAPDSYAGLLERTYKWHTIDGALRLIKKARASKQNPS